jgi:hypothetical protein
METNQIKPKYKSVLSFDFNSSRISANDAFSYMHSEAQGILNPSYMWTLTLSAEDKNGDFVGEIETNYGRKIK